MYLGATAYWKRKTVLLWQQRQSELRTERLQAIKESAARAQAARGARDMPQTLRNLARGASNDADPG